MITDLGWSDAQVEEGSEPPDFYVRRGDERVAIEVTRIYRHEKRKGSAEAEQEQEFIRFVSNLARAYNGGRASQLINVSVGFPSVIRSSAVRQFSREERQGDRAQVMRRALARLGHLPKLEPWATRRFTVRQRDGRPVTFHVLWLPNEAGQMQRWKSLNITLGWVGTVDAVALQAKVAAKARGLPKYESAVHSAVLLVVADGSRASGYLDLRDGTVVDPGGFDAVYFQRYPERTELVPARSP